MPHDAALTKQFWIVRLFSTVALAVILLLPVVSSATPPTPLNVLFVANGYYTQETQIYNHLVGLGFTVTKLKDYKVTGTTNLTPYNLIIITEFAPGIPTSGINKIKASGKPLLIVEYWDFWYSYKFGLVTTENCGYVGTTTIENIEEGGRIIDMLGEQPQMYSTSYTMYGIAADDLSADTTPIAFSSRSFYEYAVIEDAERHIVATGVYDTRKYTPEAWRYFDLLIDRVAPIGPVWADIVNALEGFAASGLMSYLDHLTGNEDPATVRAFVWNMMLAHNLWEFQYPIEEQLVDLNPYFSFYYYNPIFTLNPCLHYDPLEFPEMCWMLGEHEDASGPYVPFYYDDFITGTDLGVNVERWGRTFFYMGDTWGNLGGVADCEQISGVGRAECDDAIVLSAPSENDPTNGVDLSILGQDSGFKPINIDGVHRSFDDEVWAEWDGDILVNNNKRFSAPSGALVHAINFPLLVPAFGNYSAYDTLYSLPQTQLWYATQFKVEDATNPRAGKSWVGCSYTGASFHNCYEFINDGGLADYAYFSKEKFMQVSPVFVEAYMLDYMDPAPPHTTQGGYLLYGTGHPYRCSPVYLAYVDASDFGLVSENRPKDVYFFSTLGGSPDWILNNEAAASPITEYSDCLVTEQEFIDAGLEEEWNETFSIWQALLEEVLLDKKIDLGFGLCNEVTCAVPEFAALCDWDYESDDGVIDCSFCSNEDISACADAIAETLMRRPAPEYTSGFGELSVKIVSGGGMSGGIEPTIVMLSNHTFWDDPEREEILDAIATSTFYKDDFNWRFSRIYLRTASIYRPWELSEPVNTGNTGYGPYIMEAFTELTPSMSGEPGDPNSVAGYTVSLWHTTSSWHGPWLPGAYGTYTTRSEFFAPEY